MFSRIVDRFLASLPSSKAEADDLAEIKVLPRGQLVALDGTERGIDANRELLHGLEDSLKRSFDALEKSQEENREALARSSSRISTEAQHLRTRMDTEVQHVRARIGRLRVRR